VLLLLATAALNTYGQARDNGERIKTAAKQSEQRNLIIALAKEGEEQRDLIITLEEQTNAIGAAVSSIAFAIAKRK
jgi:hypothetical protein